MAQGISQRARLSLPTVPDELRQFSNTLERWGNRLPLAHAGFQFWRSTNETALATSNTREVTFDTAVVDHENWMPVAGTVQSIVVPPGLSGWYQFQFNIYWAVAGAGMFPFIRVNGNAVTLGASSAGVLASDSASITATWLMNDGDIITAGVLNGSGANRTITSAPGDTFNLKSPYLSAARFALL